MEKHFGDKIAVTGESTPTTTGALEVQLVDSGKVLHSKLNGDGYVDTDAKMDKIMQGVEEALKQ